MNDAKFVPKLAQLFGVSEDEVSKRLGLHPFYKVEAADSFEVCAEIYLHAPKSDKIGIKKAAREKGEKFLEELSARLSLEECRVLLLSRAWGHRILNCQIPWPSKFRGKVLDRVMALLSRSLEEATTAIQCFEIRSNAYEFKVSEVERAAWEKASSLAQEELDEAKTVSQLDDLMCLGHRYSDDLKNDAMEKLRAMFLTELDVASTPNQCAKVASLINKSHNHRSFLPIAEQAFSKAVEIMRTQHSDES